MDAEGNEVSVKITRIQGLDCLCDPPMEQTPARGQELRVDDASDPLVYEIQAADHLVQDLTADELFHTVGCCRLATRGRALEEAELEAVPDHGANRSKVACHLAQAFEPSGDHPPHPLDDRQPS